MSTQKEPSAVRKSLGDLAPKLVELTDDVLFGDVWERPQLSKRDRSLITCAALIATGKTEQMDFHFPTAIKNGVTRDEVVGFFVVTALFCLQMGFTAYAQLRLPQVAEAFTHLGFPDYFRVELSWAKLVGVALMLAPVPARLKEWAYAGFAINLGSALIAHREVGDGPEAWGWAAGTSVLWVL